MSTIPDATEASEAKAAKSEMAHKLDDERWLQMFYELVGRELVLSRESQRETHNWVVTLAIGLITAGVAFQGTVEDYPSESSFIVVLVVIPFFFRFFVRSCLEYSNFNRWVALRNSLDKYFITKQLNPESAHNAMLHLTESVRLYYFEWKSPKTMRVMLFDNLRLAYAWPTILLLGLLLWGSLFQVMTPLIRVTIIVVSFWMIVEIVWFVTYSGFRYAEPKAGAPSVVELLNSQQIK